MKTIYEFEKGDIIVRIVPAKEVGVRPDSKIRDRSYRGQKMIFAGIANGMLYLCRTKELDIKIFGDLLSLPLDLWDEGWDHWKDPKDLMYNAIDPEHLLHKIEDAVKIENYELANKLNKILNKNEKKK